MEQEFNSYDLAEHLMSQGFANADKGASVAASGGNPGYSGNYGNPETGYAANPCLTNHGMSPTLASAESSPQYEPGPGSWGAYNKHQLS